jgi:hypothetical protein
VGGGERPVLGSAPSVASRMFACLLHKQHTNSSPHLCFEGWCGAAPRVLINRRAVLSHRRSMDHPTTATLTPALCLCCLCLFIFRCAAECVLQTCGSPRYTQMLLDSVMRSIYIVCVVYNTGFSVLFEHIYISTG